MLRQYTVKHYSGLSSERPETLPFGDFFYETDTEKLYKYNESKIAIEISGSEGESGYSHTGLSANAPV